MSYQPKPLVWSGFADLHAGRDTVLIPASDSREFYNLELSRADLKRLSHALNEALRDPDENPVLRGNTRFAAQLAYELGARGVEVSDTVACPGYLYVGFGFQARQLAAYWYLVLTYTTGGTWLWTVKATQAAGPDAAGPLPVPADSHPDAVADAVVALLASDEPYTLTG